MARWKAAALCAAGGLVLNACGPGESPPEAPTEPSLSYRIETVAEGLEHPWSIAFLPSGDMLVTERPGRLRVVTPEGRVSDPIPGVPEVYNESQAGLFDIVLAPDYGETGEVYLAYAAGDADANATAVWRARFDGERLEAGEQIFLAEPFKDTNAHFGGRIVFLPDGTFLLTIGEGFEYREQAQVLANHLGTTVRLNRDGSAPADNPFVDTEGALPEIFSYGHRNAQGMVHDAETGRIWQHEHGPQGGDELNLIEPGANYGWPIATAGIDYSGARISPFESHEGFTAPVTGWTPSIAPSGLIVYRGALFPDWQGDLFVGALSDKEVHRLELDGGEVAQEEILFTEPGARIRDVAEGPDGAIYLLTDAANGKVLRIVPE